MTWFWAGLYLAAAVAANLAVAAWGPAATLPAAALCIGCDLTARDALHERWEGPGLVGRLGALIAAGSALTYLASPAAGRVALASLLAFAVSATVDSLAYGALRQHIPLVRVNGSNLASALADSLVFPTVAFGALLPWVILGQFVAKVAGGALWSPLVVALRRRRAA